MARTVKPLIQTENTHKATVAIRGILSDVYEGKTNNYLTVKVNRDDINPKTKEHYYDNIKVTATPDIELFDDGTEVEIFGTIRQYFDSAISRSTMYIVAESVSKC